MKYRIAIVTACMLLSARAATAQRSHIGVHAGYNFDIDHALVGAQMLLPLSRHVELYPSLDYYLVDSGTLFGLSGDLKFRFPAGGPSVLYLGGGVNYQHASAGSTSGSDTGIDFFGGLESRIGGTHPYFEGRVLSHNGSSFQIAVGLNVTLF